MAAGFVLGSPGLALAQSTPVAPAPGATVEVVPLRVMRDKGLITDGEYQSALKDMTESVGTKTAEDSTNFVIGKWSTTLYGFAEGDYIYDSTQSYPDLAGAGLVQRPGTYAGNNSRTQFSVRNSRVGLRFRAPEYHEIRASAVFETDFLVGEAPVGYTAGQNPYQQSENNFFTNPVMRIRHFYLKVETPVVDVLVGQTWHLFGWQGSYQPNTVQYQGIPGELYARTTQLRLSKTLKTKDLTFDVAIAAMRPPQRDSGVPEGEGGVHLAVNGWKGAQTMGATGTTVSPLSFAITGDVRHVSVPEFAAKPVNSNDKTAASVAFDAFVPVLPAHEGKLGNSLSILGEAVTGYGIVDQFTGLSSGVGFPSLPPAAGSMAAQTFNPQIDPGIVTYDATGTLRFIQWTTYRIGAQYYLPGIDGKMWLSANYSHMGSANAKDYGAATSVLSSLDWFDLNVMGDLTPAVRLGLEYANYNTEYADGIHAIDHRVQGSAFFIF